MWNCIVTGGSRGIGRGVVQRLLQSGHRVVMCDISLSGAAEVQQWVDDQKYTNNYRFIQTDVSQEDQVMQLITTVTREFMPTINLLVNNAAIASQYYRKSPKEDRFPSTFSSAIETNEALQSVLDGCDLPLLQLGLEEWNRYLQINLTSIYLMVKYTIPFMLLHNKQQDDLLSENPTAHQFCGASIINISSTRALMSEPNTEAYSATKGGVVSLTHSLAMSLGCHKIRVNCILPGWVDTLGDFVNETSSLVDNDLPVSTPHLTSVQNHGAYQYNKDITPSDHTFHPTQRVGIPHDISECVLFLGDSQKSGFITGQKFVIDGGVTTKMIYD